MAGIHFRPAAVDTKDAATQEANGRVLWRHGRQRRNRLEPCGVVVEGRFSLIKGVGPRGTFLSPRGTFCR